MIEKEENLYLAYGSNLNKDQMKLLCPNARLVQKIDLKDYRILFRGVNGRAFANIEQYEGSIVPALLWLLGNGDEEALDVFEDYPSEYHKEYIDVTIDGSKLKVMAYVLNNGYPLGQPSDNYYNTIIEGYKSAGFDINVINEAVKSSVVLETSNS